MSELKDAEFDGGSAFPVPETGAQTADVDGDGADPLRGPCFLRPLRCVAGRRTLVSSMFLIVSWWVLATPWLEASLVFSVGEEVVFIDSARPDAWSFLCVCCTR